MNIPNCVPEWLRQQEQGMYERDLIKPLGDYEWWLQDKIEDIFKYIMKGVEEETGMEMWPVEAIIATYWNGNQERFQFNNECFYLGIYFQPDTQSFIITESHDGVEIEGLVVKMGDKDDYGLLVESRPEKELYCPSCGVPMERKESGIYVCSCGIDCYDGLWSGIGE